MHLCEHGLAHAAATVVEEPAPATSTICPLLPSLDTRSRKGLPGLPGLPAVAHRPGLLSKLLEYLIYHQLQGAQRCNRSTTGEKSEMS